MSRLMHLAVLAVPLLSATAALAVPNYVISALPSPDTTDVYVKGINNAGQIVGYTYDLDGVSHAALWDNTGIHYLNPLDSSHNSSAAYRINNNGEIVGKSQYDDNYNHATYWSPAGVPTDIGTPGGAGGSFANDINDNGVVVGSGSAAHGQHAFTWTAAGGIDDWGSFNSNVNAEIAGFNAINSSGLMGGTHYYFSDPYKGMTAQYGDPRKTLTNVSPAGGRFSQGMVLAINDAGTVVGYQNAYSGDGQAAIFNPDGTFTQLGALGLDASRALDINEDGVIVGNAYGETSASFVYIDKEMYDLSTLITNFEGWDILFEAAAINDNGDIVGEGVYNGQITGFVLHPTAVPEPSAAIFGLPTAALLVRRRR